MIRSPWATDQSPGLLVSVRSAEEAIEAVRGGASVIDIKEPSRGPLGRADPVTWRAVRTVVPEEIPVSVALGELADWTMDIGDYAGIGFRKLGLAGAPADWKHRWADVRRFDRSETHWVAVAYADYELADSPHPDEVLGAAMEADDCAGILVDTWDKTRPGPLTASLRWSEWVQSARRGGRFVVLAGGLDAVRIEELAPLRPNLFAVRGAACLASNRVGTVQAERVANLVWVVKKSGR